MAAGGRRIRPEMRKSSWTLPKRRWSYTFPVAELLRKIVTLEKTKMTVINHLSLTSQE